MRVVCGCYASAPPELGPVDSTISGSPEEPAALDATAGGYFDYFDRI